MPWGNEALRRQRHYQRMRGNSFALGYRHSKETRELMSKNNRLSWTAMRRQQQSERMKGNTLFRSRAR